MADLKRSDIEQKYKWRLEDMLESQDAWEELFKKAETLSASLEGYKGKLSDPDTAAQCLIDESELSLCLERLYVYAHMRRDEDSTVSLYQGLADRAMGLVVRANTASSFVTPELSALPEDELKALAAHPKLAGDYDRFFHSLIRQKPHILSEREERLIALGGEVSSGFAKIFAMLNNADHLAPTIKDEDGKSVKITHGTYSVMLQNKNQEVRRRAYNAYYRYFKERSNTITAIYSSLIAKDIYHARARGHSSCLSAALFGEEVSPDVYNNLLSAVEENTPLLHDYMALRKKITGLDNMYMSDMHFPMFENADIKLPYEEAYALVKAGLAPLGKEYAQLLETAYSGGWIDVLESKGKRSGAYSWGCYGTHPYVLLNHELTTHGIFTIAHEMGHAIHSYYSDKNQPYIKAQYTIFVAEVASTVNEVLLLRHIIGNTSDVNLKKFLLSYFLDMVRTTIFRQTQFAQFESEAHAMAERGQPLTKEELNKFYFDLNKKYYGDAVTYDGNIAHEWSRIPHFFNSPFYVYKYSTGLTAAITIAGKILAEGEPMVKDYMKFLSSGCSSDPVDLLRIAHVDLSQKQPFEFAMQQFKSTLEELKSLT